MKRWVKIVQSFKKKIKYLLYFCVYYSGLLSVFLILFTFFKRDHTAIILFYHQIVNPDMSYLDKGPAVHRKLKDFENEMRHISKWYEVISIDKLVQDLENEKKWKKPTIAITFDDGYRDNYIFAYPILRKYKLPATIYLTTGLIGTDQMTWLDQIENVLLCTNQSFFQFPGLFGEEVLDISSIEKKRIINDQIATEMKKIKTNKRIELTKELIQKLNIGTSMEDLKTRKMLHWDEITEMDQNGVTFGAHTHTHPILSKMNFQEAKKEIMKSKHTIEKHLKKTTNHFAIPNGKEVDFSCDLRDSCKEIQFKSVSTTHYGSVDRSSDTFSLNRISPDPPLYHFVVELVRVGLKTELRR